MRYPCMLVAFACCLWCGFSFVWPGNTLAGEVRPAWVSKIVSVQGQAFVKRAGESEWQPVRSDDIFFPGDAVRVATNSRAAVVLSNESVLRVDQDTTLVFTGIEQQKTFLMELLEGAAFFFSRKARSLKVVTPFVNGVVEGTEFFVRVDAHRTTIILYEGAVLAENRHGNMILAKGEATVAATGQAPRLETIVRPRDAVQWALYYPPILAMRAEDNPPQGPDAWQTRVRRSMEHYQAGRLDQAFAAIEGLGDSIDDAQLYVYRAALRLAVGRVDDAVEDIDRGLSVDANNSAAMALRSIVAVVQNRGDDGLRDARSAVEMDGRSAAARIALSYALQARFDIESASDAARMATQLEPDNSLAWARLAELELSLGDTENALQAAEKASALSPDLAHIQTVLGYAHLTRIQTQKALDAFTRATALDDAAPLPRLGAGLARIREGDLPAGRADIELAAGLAPDNALIRSYLGKAYFDEKRDPLDERQFEMAKQLDPNDPTPWFYDAIRKQSVNRPGEALLDMQKAIELNDNRAVYRSRLLLDDDLAVRSAALGRIYSDLSFQEVALNQGWKSLNADPGNFSAHRLLADMYTARPRHEIARVSELLQSQLLQPLNLNPIPPQLAERNQLNLNANSLTSAGFNEFDSLFTRDEISLRASGIAGESGTYSDDISISGLVDKFSLSLGQFHYESDGFRENNDLDQNIYNVFAQTKLNSEFSLQAEYRYKKTESGDLRLSFDPDTYLPNQRNDERIHSFRFGVNFSPDTSNTLLLSLIYSDAESRLSDKFEFFDPFFQLSEDTKTEADSNVYSGEIQYLRKSRSYNFVMGAGHLDQDRTDDLLFVSTSTFPPLPPMIDSFSTSVDQDVKHSNGYAYLNFNGFADFSLTAAGSYDSFDGSAFEEDRFNPKIGAMWSPLQAITLRAAWFRTIKRPFNANQTLEPTNVAGFNQFFDDLDGAKTERYGVAMDTQFSLTCFGGIEFSWRDIDTPRYDEVLGITTTEEETEKLHRAYLYWTPIPQMSLSAEGFYEKIERPETSPNELITYQTPLSLGYFFGDGPFIKITATYVDQKLVDATTTQRDHFWITDASFGFRFPKRWGQFTFGVRNLFNESFNYQDSNFNTGEAIIPLFQPERLVFCKLSFTL